MATDADALDILRRLGASVRVTTLEWLFLDLLNVTPVRARELLSELERQGHIRLIRGGWIELTG